MAASAEDRQVGDVVRATLRDAQNMVTLPPTRLEDDLAALTPAMSSLEGVLPVPGVLRIFVGAAVRVPLIPDRLINLWLMVEAVVAL